MSHLFDIAACMAQKKAMPKPQIRVMINMAGGGGLPSLKKNININGQPHKLSYINNDEDALLRQLGGLGKPVKGTGGVPAYIGVGDAGGLGEDYGTGDDASMGGGFGDDSTDMDEDSMSRGMSAAWSDPSLDATGPGSAWGQGWDLGQPGFWDKAKKVGGVALSTVLNMLAANVAPALNIAARTGVIGEKGKGLGHAITGYKGAFTHAHEGIGKALGIGTAAAAAGKDKGSDYDPGDDEPGDPNIDEYDDPDDYDSRSENEFITAEEAAEEDAENRDSAMKGYFTATGEETTTEPWWDTLTENQQDILIQAFGPNVAKEGLPDIMKQVYGNRGTA